MAVDLSKLVAEVKQTIGFEALSGKKVAIDAYNAIYQFLSIIRQPDGTPLVDSKNRVTSHLSGLFYRTINMIEYGITPIYVFDGVPSTMKRRTIEARMNRREEALQEWEKAREKGMIEEARAYAMASTRINKDIVESAKELLNRMGVLCLQAPSEGEAQAAQMVRAGAAYAAASQDYDLFLFGANVIARNLTISGRRKLPRKNVYVDVNPELILLDDFLSKFGITQRQAILMGILIGTDFNEGIKGVGPLTALKIVKEKKGIKEVEGYVKEKYGKEFDADPAEVEDLFANPEVEKLSAAYVDERLKSMKFSRESIVSFMCDEHGFSEERIGKFADRLSEAKQKAGQKSISKWF